MKRFKLLAIFIIFIGFSCDKKSVAIDETEVVFSTICNGKELEDMQWFRDIVEEKTTCKILPLAYIAQVSYQGKEIFYLNNPASSQWVCGQMLYDCSGTVISEDWTFEQWREFKNKYPIGTGNIVWKRSLDW